MVAETPSAGNTGAFLFKRKAISEKQSEQS